MAITLVWAAAALHEVILKFPGGLPAQVIFAVTAVYLLAVGLSRTLLGRDSAEDTPE